MKFHGFSVIPTSAEVWAVLRARHGTLMKVWSTYSNPSPGYDMQASMETVYGFDAVDYPLLGARTTWIDKQPEDYTRHDERNEYFLVLPLEDSE